MIKRVTEDIFYIGVDDLDLDLFESQYIVPEGVSYNSYLVRDGKIAVMDTVDARKGAEWLSNLEEALEGRVPDYLVMQHIEPDHSGVVTELMRRYPGLTLVATAKAVSMLDRFYDDPALFEGRTLAVKEGDTLPLGAHTLRFATAAMVHWPEVMVSFDEKDRVLFSADAFGKFGALSRCGYFSEEEADWACEARRYYFNICGKYGGPVQMLLKKVAAISPAVVAPLHGPVLRGDLTPYVSLYQTWSTYGVESEGVFVAYASIHGGTAAAARRFADILRGKGCPKVVLCDLTRCDMAEAVEDAFRFGKMALLACSYDAGLFTPAHTFLHTLQMKAWCKRKVALVENGSWAPSAARVMTAMLSEMKDVEIVGTPVTLLSRMKEADIPALESLADALLA